MTDARRWTGPSIAAIAWAAIGIGILARLVTPWAIDIFMDGATYTAMAHALAQGSGLLMPYGPISDPSITAPAPSHHYPPAYPFYLSLFYRVFGFGIPATRAAVLLLSLGTIGVVYWVTRDLYGHLRGLIAAGIVALQPILIWGTGTGFSENLVLVFYALTLWGIIKSLEKEPYIVAAGLAAGLAYLTRSSMGMFFLIAGLGGFLWRWLFMKWRVFTNVWYLTAIAVFGTLVGVWTARNIRVFGGFPTWDPPWHDVGGTVVHAFSSGGTLATILVVALIGAGILWIGRPRPETPGSNGLPAQMTPPIYFAASIALVLIAGLLMAWVAREGDVHGMPDWETSSSIGAAFDDAASMPGLWLGGMALKIPLFLLFFLPFLLAFWPEVRASVRRIREEHESALWLGVVLITIISWAVAAMFWIAEDIHWFFFDNIRYVVVAFVPLVWIGLRHGDIGSASFRIRVGALASVLLVLVALVLATPYQYPEGDVMDAIELEPGDRLAVHGVQRYAIYPYMNEHDVEVVKYRSGESDADYILSWDRPEDTTYPGYHWVAESTIQYLSGNTLRAVVWEADRR